MESEEFAHAGEVDDTAISVRERIDRLWGMLGAIKVKCPSCQTIQKVQTDLTTTCRKCGHSYKIFPSTSPSRVVWCPKGKLYLLHQIRSLRVSGKYVEIL